MKNISISFMIFLGLLLSVSVSFGADWNFEIPRVVGQVKSYSEINRNGKVKADPQRRPKDEVWKVWEAAGPHAIICPSNVLFPPHQAYSQASIFSYAGAQDTLFLMSAQVSGLGIVQLGEDASTVSGAASGGGIMASTGRLVLADYGNATKYTVTTELKFGAILLGANNKSFDRITISFGQDRGIKSQLTAKFDKISNKWLVTGNVFKYVDGAHENELISEPLSPGWTKLDGYKKTHSHNAPVVTKCRYTIIVNSSYSQYSVSKDNYAGPGFADILTKLEGNIRQVSTELQP